MTTSERGMTNQDEARQDDEREETASRGSDDRRSEVDPAQNPAPRSPEPDQEAVDKGETMLERVKPY